MRRHLLAGLVVVLCGSTLVFAQRAAAPPRAATKSSTVATCAADLGSGVRSHRRFCDVLISARGGTQSVSMAIPSHTGTATLRFDLHNRFNTPASGEAPADTFASQVAVVAVVRTTGVVVERAAVAGEFRTAADAFDQIAGVKAIAPGPAVAVSVTVPAGLTAIGIVGVKLEATTVNGHQVFDTPGRPVAIVSNLRIDYVPAK